MSDLLFPDDAPINYEPPQLNGPRPFGEIPSLWFKLFKMDEAFFAEEAQYASAGNTLISVIIYAVVSTLLMMINLAIYSAGQFNELFSMLQGTDMQTLANPLLWVLFFLCAGLVGTPISFYWGIAMIHLGAVVLGGKGSYNTLAYLCSLFFVPLGVAMSLVSLVPCLGGLAALAGLIYMLILYVQAIKVTYSLGSGKAVVAYFLVTIVVLVLFACCIGLGLALMGPSIGNLFQGL